MTIFRNLHLKESSTIEFRSAGRSGFRLTFFIAVWVALVSTAGLSEDLVDPASLNPYFLQTGDRVLVALSGRTYFAYETAVTPEGKLFIQIPTDVVEHPFEVIDEVVIIGLGIVQAESLVTQAFSEYFRDVDVNLSLIELSRFSVPVGGEVVKPGIYQATPFMRVSQVLDMAQLKGNASQSRIQLVRGGKQIDVDIHKFEVEGDMESNPFLIGGDMVFVPRMEASVLVRGAVYGAGVHVLRISELTAEQTRMSEGTYELLFGERVSDILMKAGGTTPWADLRNAYLERTDSETGKTVRVSVSLPEILSHIHGEADIVMRNGDVLVVPSQEEKVYVAGAVNNPGGFDYQATLSITDYIGLAGGPTSRANLKKIQILRVEGAKITVPYETRSVVLLRGDTIIVPELTLRWWQDYVTILTAVSSVVISWLVFAK